MLLHGLQKKAGQPPGTPIYTGNKTDVKTVITVIEYSKEDYFEKTGSTLEECLLPQKENSITWLNIEGLNDIDLIKKIANRYELHPLTVEDILNVDQRPKVEEYDNYVFITLKILLWKEKENTFSIEQLSIIVSKHFILSFQESDTTLFNSIRERLSGGSMQRLRQHGTDYLSYRLIDAIVDQYFVVLEELGENIEKVERRIIISPTPQNSRTIYRLKHQMLVLRKVIWPMREALSHLMQVEGDFITSFTRLYLRDVYDHTVQAIDTLETFRDMLSGMLDVYLSSLTNRMNEIMKVLTIISTIFMPMTFIASIYGMNFDHMPELRWRYGYAFALGLMLIVGLIMVYYFRRKKWL